MNQRRQHLWTWGLLLGGSAVALAWFALSPLLYDQRVDEPPPRLTDLAPAHVPQAAAVKQEPLSADAASATPAEQAERMREAAAQPDQAVNEFMPPMDEIPPEALRMRRAVLSGADEVHQARGEVRFYQTDFGDGLLRLEEFRVTNGPDLVVLLSKHPQPADADDLRQGHLVLGELKGNIGNQNYSISGHDDLDEFQAAVIYCRLFHVVFATATLGPTEAVEIRDADDE